MVETRKDWEEESTKSTFLAKGGTVVGRYVRSVQDQESVGLLFRLRTGSAGLEDKRRCRKVNDERCVKCDSAVGNLGEIGRYCWMMYAELWGAEWLDKFW